MVENKNLFIIYDNFKLVFFKTNYLIIGLFVGLLIGTFFVYHTDTELILGNEGVIYYFLQVFFQLMISVLFAIFLPVSLYKYASFSKFDLKENSTSFIGTFFGIIVAGCPACSITLASYIGLAGVISLLPYHGLELKIIGALLLVYANYSLLLNLQTCKLKKRNVV